MSASVSSCNADGRLLWAGTATAAAEVAIIQLLQQIPLFARSCLSPFLPARCPSTVCVPLCCCSHRCHQDGFIMDGKLMPCIQSPPSLHPHTYARFVYSVPWRLLLYMCRYHQYKFIVDGKWMHDETAPYMPDPLGNVNNWLFVRKIDPPAAQNG